MAWVDDRIWCHPKFTDISSPAFRAWVCGIAYSSGMATRGRLTAAQQRMVGANAKIRAELIAAGLWDVDGSGVRIHDWDEHNEKRDDRRARDRDRKKAKRLAEKLAKEAESESSPGASAGKSAGQSTGTSDGTSGGASAGTARGEGSEGSEEPLKPPSGKSKFKCPECPTEFTSQQRLSDHRYNVHHVEPLRAVS